MSQTRVTCPQCRSRLRSAQPIPVGSSLSCPDCEATFTAPEASPNRFGPFALIAVSVAAILGGSLVLAAVLMNRPAPGPVANLQQSEKDARQKELDDRQKKLTDILAKTEYTRLLARGDDALRKQQYAEAEEAYSKAADLLPGESEALKGLATARAALAAATKGTEDDAKRQAEIDRLVAEAKQATADKQLAQAVRLLESARTIGPTNRVVLDALAAAQLALDADQTQKTSLADYRKLMDAAKASLIAERYTDAVRDFQAALRLMPDDLEAQQGVKQAEAKLAGLADQRKRQAAFDALLDRGRASHAAKRYNDAIAALESALRLIPDDRDATRLLSGSRDALKQAKSKNAKLVLLAEDSLRLGRYEEAQTRADEAVKNWAEDARAEKLLRRAEQLIANLRANIVAFRRYMETGAVATAALRYADAVNAYTEALRLDPTNAEVMRLLRNANLSLVAANQAVVQNLKGQAEYDRLMKVGSAALKRNAYADASKTFRDALKLVPDDADATAGLSKAKYGRAMVDGSQALRLKRKADAVRFFEAALVEVPDDFQAKSGLQKAKMLK
jgi:tetratricopeptide (TPR) repeat protein